jgi:hypothetical protein
MYSNPAEMEPLLPRDPGILSELGVELVKKSSALGSMLRGGTRDSMIELLRQMNQGLIYGLLFPPRLWGITFRGCTQKALSRS